MENNERKMSRLKLFDATKIDRLREDLLNLQPKGVPLTKILCELKIAFSNGYSLKELSMICKKRGIVVSPEYLQKVLSMDVDDIDDKSLYSLIDKTESIQRQSVIKTNFGDI